MLVWNTTLNFTFVCNLEKLQVCWFKLSLYACFHPYLYYFSLLLLLLFWAHLNPKSNTLRHQRLQFLLSMMEPTKRRFLVRLGT
jgi:hypothetical protein